MRSNKWLGLALVASLATGCKACHPCTIVEECRENHFTPNPHDPQRNNEQPVIVSPLSRAGFYHLEEGSEVFPLAFLRALDTTNHKPFMSTDNLELYGLLQDDVSPENRQGLPIGMTLGAAGNPALLGFRVVGFNCAACHVGRFDAQDKQLVVDGAPNMFDIKAFNRDVGNLFKRTLLRPREFFAFARRMFTDERSKGDPNARNSLLQRPGSVAKMIYVEVPELRELEKGGKIDKLLASSILDTIEREREAAAKMSLDELLRAQVGPVGKKRGMPTRAMARKAAPKGPARGEVPNEQLVSVLDEEASQALGEQLASAQLLSALSAPDAQPEFLKPVPRGESAKRGVLEFLADLAQVTRWVAQRVNLLIKLEQLDAYDQNTHAGPGRVDAFTTARNLLFDEAIPTTAPISFPHLWGFSQAEWLHWDANTNSIMERNIGQALGLGAVVNRENQSSVKPRQIHQLEQYARAIPAPKWPFGAIDEAKRSEGEKHFTTYCVSCHGPGAPLRSNVGTDMERVRNFNTPVNGTPFVHVLGDKLELVKQRAFVREGSDGSEYGPDPSEWIETDAYANRPLAGIWASPPYLHNASVRTLADLLKPAAERPKKFHVGTREYDTVNLGYVSAGCFELDTSKVGNRNVGHEYGVTLTAAQKTELLEYLKSL